MQIVDKAADSTLSELFEDLCHSGFHPEETAYSPKVKDIVGDRVCYECRRGDLPGYEKRMAIINALRSSGEPGAFPTFVFILESDLANSSIVQKVKGMVYILFLR